MTRFRLRVGFPSGDGGIALVFVDLSLEGLFGDVVEFANAFDDRFRVIEGGVDLTVQIQ